jgi:hypothetical protein
MAEKEVYRRGPDGMIKNVGASPHPEGKSAAGGMIVAANLVVDAVEEPELPLPKPVPKKK